MKEKKTQELENILKSTHISDFNAYCADNRDSMISQSNSFSEFMKTKIKENKMTQQAVFIAADIPEGYGYKLLSGEKRTKQRDVILRICYAGQFTLEDTQTALKKYGMPVLYVKVPRDALLMIIFDRRPGSIIDVNSYLRENGMSALRSSGLQE